MYLRTIIIVLACAGVASTRSFERDFHSLAGNGSLFLQLLPAGDRGTSAGLPVSAGDGSRIGSRNRQASRRQTKCGNIAEDGKGTE